MALQKGAPGSAPVRLTLLFLVALTGIEGVWRRVVCDAGCHLIDSVGLQFSRCRRVLSCTCMR
jgi:hypothetical protein